MKQNIINVTIFEEKNPTKDSPLATVRYTEYSCFVIVEVMEEPVNMLHYCSTIDYLVQ